MTKWEYKLDELNEGEHDGDEYVPFLNARGEEGWEMCAITWGQGVLSLHWKRPRET